MPNFNGTGPQGQGPTGRREGICKAGTRGANPEENFSFADMGKRLRGYLGRGRGRGCSNGNGAGQGGRGNGRGNGRR